MPPHEARSGIDCLFFLRSVRLGWHRRGGFEGYANHVREVVEKFEHVELHPDVWTKCAPPGSLSIHQVLKAVALATDEDRASELAWRLRLAFFRDCRDVARLDEQLAVAGELDVPLDRIIEANIEELLRANADNASWC